MVEAKNNTAHQGVVKLGIDEIKKLPGHFDNDGFYILDEGGFYDPDGFHYDKNGVDAVGGFYNKAGMYIAPQKNANQQLNEDGRSVLCVKLSPAAICTKEGAYDGDGFFIMADKSMYDPLGYFFDKDGYDTAGGKYDERGYYVHPEYYQHEAAHGDDLEDYTLDEEEDFVEEDQAHLNDSDFER